MQICWVVCHLTDNRLLLWIDLCFANDLCNSDTLKRSVECAEAQHWPDRLVDKLAVLFDDTVERLDLRVPELPLFYRRHRRKAAGGWKGQRTEHVLQ